jgi:glycosyltransferase involved in cell wall biosynthesis
MTISLASSQQTADSFLRRLDRPRILYVIQVPDYSGGELLQLPIMRADADPLLACPPDSRVEALAADNGIPTVALPFRSLRHSGGKIEIARSLIRGLASARDLRRIIRRHPERTLIYCTQLRPGMLAALAAFGLRRRVLWHVPDFMPPSPVRGLVALLARVGCDRAVALSRAVREDFVGRSRRLRSRTSVIYPGPDTSGSVGEPAEAPRAAIVGQVSPIKRTELAVEIAKRVAATEPGFELSIVGRAQFRPEDFDFERELKRDVAKDSSLRDHVRFAGYIDDVRSELARCRLLLHCRPDEPFGIALTEAMAAGLPVVAPASAGPAEIVEHGKTGFLYPPGNVERAAEFVVELLRDRGMAAEMGTAGRDRVERMFSVNEQVVATEAVLTQLAQRVRSIALS